MALALAAPAVAEPGAVDAEVFAPADLERRKHAAEVDREAAAARGLAADRAVAAHERHRLVRLHASCA